MTSGDGAGDKPPHVTPSTLIFFEVCDFQKGIRHEITLNPIFKDDRQYDSWYCKPHAISSIHGTKHIFDSHHRPTETSQA